MFNFKEGLKRKVLKVKYFKHPGIAHDLFSILLVAYGVFQWNDEVPHYFVRIFYADIFLGLRTNYIDLSSKHYPESIIYHLSASLQFSIGDGCLKQCNKSG